MFKRLLNYFGYMPISEHEDIINSLEIQLKDVANDCKIYKSKIGRYLAEKNNAEMKVMNLQHKLDMCNDELRDKQDHIKKLQLKVRNTEKSYSNCRSNLSKAKKKLKETREKYDSLREETDTLIEICEDRNKSLKQAGEVLYLAQAKINYLVFGTTLPKLFEQSVLSPFEHIIRPVKVDWFINKFGQPYVSRVVDKEEN